MRPALPHREQVNSRRNVRKMDQVFPASVRLATCQRPRPSGWRARLCSGARGDSGGLEPSGRGPQRACPAQLGHHARRQERRRHCEHGKEDIDERGRHGRAHRLIPTDGARRCRAPWRRSGAMSTEAVCAHRSTRRSWTALTASSARGRRRMYHAAGAARPFPRRPFAGGGGAKERGAATGDRGARWAASRRVGREAWPSAMMARTMTMSGDTSSSSTDTRRRWQRRGGGEAARARLAASRPATGRAARRLRGRAETARRPLAQAARPVAIKG